MYEIGKNNQYALDLAKLGIRVLEMTVEELNFIIRCLNMIGKTDPKHLKEIEKNYGKEVLAISKDFNESKKVLKNMERRYKEMLKMMNPTLPLLKEIRFDAILNIKPNMEYLFKPSSREASIDFLVSIINDGTRECKEKLDRMSLKWESPSYKLFEEELLKIRENTLIALRGALWGSLMMEDEEVTMLKHKGSSKKNLNNSK